MTLRHKLFIALLAVALTVTAFSYLFMRWSFERGFIQFVETRDAERLASLVDRLGEVYQAEGGWQQIMHDKKRWGQLNKGEPMSAVLPVKSNGVLTFPGEPRKRIKGGKFALLDAEGQVLIGRSEDRARIHVEPIRVQGRLVGYVGKVLEAKPLNELVDVDFAARQRTAFALIALALVIVASFAAWPLAATLTRRLSGVAEAVSSLARGRLDTRLAVEGGDELAQLARHVNAMAATLEGTEGARRQWMADVAHELRTPLSLLKAELEALQDGVRPLDRDAVLSLTQEVERLGRLVEDLYQLSLTDLGAMAYHKDTVSPGALLGEVVTGVEAELARKEIRVSLAGSDGGREIVADADRLRQLFLNLLQNALRYTHPGGCIEITLSETPDHVVLDFDDSPPGVPVETLARLFDRFYRVEGSRSRAHGGAGLGLAICRNIVEAHGGAIEARPSRLGGLNIRVSLPCT